jgi:hypothetical protein
VFSVEKDNNNIVIVNGIKKLRPRGFEMGCGGRRERDFDLVIALRPQTPKHIRGGWSHYTDTSEPVDGGVGIYNCAPPEQSCL